MAEMNYPLSKHFQFYFVFFFVLWFRFLLSQQNEITAAHFTRTEISFVSGSNTVLNCCEREKKNGGPGGGSSLVS